MKKAIFAVPVLCGFCMIFLLTRQFNYSAYIQTTARVIYVPVYFWLFYTAYLFASYSLFLKRTSPVFPYIKKGILWAFFLHLYLMLGNLVIYLSKIQSPLSGMYVLYIKAIFLFLSAAAGLTIAKYAFPGNKKNAVMTLVCGPFAAAVLYFFSYYLLSGYFIFAAAIGCFAGAGAAFNFVKIHSVAAFAKKLFSKDLNVFTAIFILAFIVRALFGVILVNKTIQRPEGYDGYLYASDDALTYDTTARKILNDPSLLRQGKIVLWGHWDEFYSLFLALFYKIFGRNFYMLTLAQAALGAFIPAFIFLIGKLLFSRTVGVIAAVFLCLKGGLILLSAYMGHEGVWVPFLYLFILLLTRYFRYPAARKFSGDILMGAAIGVLAVFRSMYFYFLPFVCLWELLFFRKIKIMPKLRHLFTIALICVVVIGGVFYAFNNKISLLNRNKAQCLWTTGRFIHPFQYVGNQRLADFGVNPFRSPKESLDAIMRKPFEFLVLAVKIYPLRVAAYFETGQFGFFDPIYMVNPVKIENKFASTLEFYFTLFFLIGLAGCVFRKGVLNSPVFLVLVFHVLFFSVLLFHPSPRLKEISTPVIYLIGSFGAYLAFNFLTTNNYMRLSGEA